MSPGAVADLILVLAVLAAPAAAWDETTARLVWRDLAGLPSDVSAAARGELERLYAAAGVRVAWVELGEPGLALSVIVMDADPHQLRLPKNVMGVARPGSDAAWIVYGALLRTLGTAGRAAHGEADGPSVGRALGRVIAHEVVHALARPHVHAARGLMGARLGRAALLASDIEWDDTSRRALVDGLATGPGRGCSPRGER
jgi:hypothetical protein